MNSAFSKELGDESLFTALCFPFLCCHLHFCIALLLLVNSLLFSIDTKIGCLSISNPPERSLRAQLIQIKQEGTYP